MHSENMEDECTVWLTDFQGWVLTNTPLPLLRECTHIIQNHYPGLISVAILSNPPRIFESFWKVIILTKLETYSSTVIQTFSCVLFNWDAILA